MHTCQLCGELMPASEAAFKFHGYTGPCPKPPLPETPIIGDMGKLLDSLFVEANIARPKLKRIIVPGDQMLAILVLAKKGLNASKE